MGGGSAMNAGTPQHPQDIPAANLKRALTQAHRPDLLNEIVETSRRTFGFFTRHYPHTINYTWVLERLEFLKPSSNILDMGAGVSPLPVMLAGRGHKVDCVDGSRYVRKFPVDASWNEWGFFDYAAIHPNLVAWNLPCNAFAPSQLYDRIYSVSVLAHMRSSERDEALSLMSSWLKPGGRMLFAVDLLPASDFLWNRSDGVEIDPPERHGTIDDLGATLASLGLRITERRTIRTPYQSRTDLLFLECLLPLK
jgi:SAM-dependent methyltransferase